MKSQGTTALTMICRQSDASEQLSIMGTQNLSATALSVLRTLTQGFTSKTHTGAGFDISLPGGRAKNLANIIKSALTSHGITVLVA